MLIMLSLLPVLAMISSLLLADASCLVLELRCRTAQQCRAAGSLLADDHDACAILHAGTADGLPFI